MSQKLPIVFLHGFLGSPSDWDGVFSFLPDRECVALNLPGHSGTPFTSDFTKWMPSLEKFHLVGYSLGGRLALQYTHLFSRKVASLTLASSHAGLRTEEEKKERFLLDTMWAERLLSLPLEAFLSKWYTQPIFGGFQPDLSKRRLHDAKELAKTMLHYSLSKQPFLDPKNALVMVGEKDEKYRTLWPKAKIIPNAAHMIHLENPSLFAQFLLHQL